MDSPTKRLEIGEMPEPCFIGGLSRTDHTNWIGMNAYGLDRTIKTFAFWKTIRELDLNEPQQRYKLATVLAKFFVERDAEMAIGRALDISTISPEKGIAVIREPQTYGIYVIAHKRPFFSLLSLVEPPEQAERKRQLSKLDFDGIVRKALDVLPYDGR